MTNPKITVTYGEPVVDFYIEDARGYLKDGRAEQRLKAYREALAAEEDGWLEEALRQVGEGSLRWKVDRPK